jgi:hypothetical protein
VHLVEEAIINFIFGCSLMVPICLLSYMHSKLGALFVLFFSLIATSFIATFLVDQVQRAGLAVIAGYVQSFRKIAPNKR